MTKIKILYRGDLRTICTHESGATIETDAPKDIQGKGELFSPTDLIGTGLASCMLTLMAIHGRRLGVDLKGSSAEVTKEMSAESPRRIARIIVRLQSPLRPSDEIRKKLEQAALQCPVHHSLHPDVKQEVDFIWGI